MPGIMELHGGTVVAMKTKNCVAIASDLRLGSNTHTIATNVSKVHPISDKLMVAFTGFNADCTTLVDQLRSHKTIYEMREQRQLTPKVLLHYVNNLLYQKRFGPYFVNPIVAGLDPKTNEAFIGASDVIGSSTEPKDFVIVGTGDEFGLVVCEAFWKPDLTPDELTEATAQAILSVVERDASTGWGAVVHTITPEGVIERTLKCRMD